MEPDKSDVPRDVYSARLRELFRVQGHQRRVLVWLAVALVPSFSLTAFLADTHRAEYRTHAYEWLVQGEAALGSERYDDAIAAFQSALRFARGDRTIRLRLAEALAAAGRNVESRAYLLGLWQEQPGNGPVNLELARLSARLGNVDDAVRYYRTAVQGAWGPEAERRRRETRLELSELLVREGRYTSAEVELIALTADLPPDRDFRTRTGQLLAAAGSHRRALDVHQATLKEFPDDPAALHGAGAAALALGDHPGVVRFFARIPASEATPEMTLALETSRLYLASDPFRRGLSSGERAARVRRALERAADRAQACPAAEAFDEARAASAAAVRTETRAALARDSERLERAFMQAVAVIRATEAACGPLLPLDRALLLLGERGEASP